MNTEKTLKPSQAEGTALNVQLDVNNAQLGISAGADFDNNIWSFQMTDGFKAGVGNYMIIKVVSNVEVS